jgi:carboxymethylenebutenolidase
MSEVTLQVGGGPRSGYLARPPGGGPWPGVVLIHEIFGLNEDIRELSERFAGKGSLALAPDFYAGGKWRKCIRVRGGGFALLSAPRYDFAAASVNYGEVPQDAERILGGACPIVASYGGRDRTMRGRPERLKRALEVNDVEHDLAVYPDAGHGFLVA